MTVLTQLGQLIGDAEQRGDDRAVLALRSALELIDDYGATDRALKDRRHADAERQRRKREKPIQSHGSHVTSRESRDGSQGFPGPLPNSPTTTHDTPRAQANSVYAESVDNLIAIVSEKVGDRWGDIDSFLKRRQFQTWKAWLKEMLAVSTGGKATMDDLAQACRDDGALERPLASPSALRSFVSRAFMERTSRPPSAAGANSTHGVRPGIGKRAHDTTLAAIEDL